MTARTATSNGTLKSNGTVQPPGAGPGPIVGGDIVSLNPADGLFLQAEHLTAIEDYTRALTRALGVAGGTGVVYGYGITVHGATLEVTAGLAIDFHVLPVFTTDSASPLPCIRKPVSKLICAIGASAPKFHTIAASTFRPAASLGARSTVSNRQ